MSAYPEREPSPIEQQAADIRRFLWELDNETPGHAELGDTGSCEQGCIRCSKENELSDAAWEYIIATKEASRGMP